MRLPTHHPKINTVAGLPLFDYAADLRHHRNMPPMAARLQRRFGWSLDRCITVAELAGFGGAE